MYFREELAIVSFISPFNCTVGAAYAGRKAYRPESAGRLSTGSACAAGRAAIHQLLARGALISQGRNSVESEAAITIILMSGMNLLLSLKRA